ncbi:MAG TPA: endonuclease/exonuclease/phosphatase family protein, partial [Longimicrobiales bacterium]|nr:endonuclease/exonuclease/phosphatase family protein [Longimicrobiales bacterium]
FRFAQASEVANHLDGISGPWIIAGDFNDEPRSRTLDLFQARAREAVKPTDHAFTFPSREPVKEIDFIFVSPPYEWDVNTVRVVSDTMASDHLPVLAELERQSTQSQSAPSPAC